MSNSCTSSWYRALSLVVLCKYASVSCSELLAELSSGLGSAAVLASPSLDGGLEILPDRVRFPDCSEILIAAPEPGTSLSLPLLLLTSPVSCSRDRMGDQSFLTVLLTEVSFS